MKVLPNMQNTLIKNATSYMKLFGIVHAPTRIQPIQVSVLIVFHDSTLSVGSHGFSDRVHCWFFSHRFRLVGDDR